jgi:hypothetical protein
MLDALLVFILVAIGGIWTCVGLNKLVQWVDRSRPRDIDYVAQRKRRITHNGFKSRAGMR